ncbi:MAG TPA: DUF3303 family protein [Chloroflexota bacterium]|nr:DUF3303 family protein [Chloroflexota bacterium]
MRFLIAETHDPERCVEMRPIYQKMVEERFLGAPVKVLAAYTCRPEHTYWFIVEADSYDQIEEFCRPREFMRTRVTPVRPLLE